MKTRIGIALVVALLAASLAWAPMAPTAVQLARGENNADAVLSWKHSDEADLAGFAVVTRATQSPYWEREVFVGNKMTFTMKDLSIDEWLFGIKAIDREGNESQVTPFLMQERRKVEVKTE